MVRRRAYDPRAVGSKPALATFEEIIFRQGVKTNCSSLYPGVQMGARSVVMNAVCGLHPAKCY